MENSSSEINLIQLAKTIWGKKFLVVAISSLFIIIGVINALTSPIVYSSSTTFIPSNQESSSAGSNLSGVASLVGINLGGLSSGSEIPASMYPQVGESTNFKRLLLNSFIDEKKEVKLSGFLIKHYAIDDATYKPNSNKYFVSKAEDILFKILSNIIKISVNQKDGFVSITANMPESEYAANSCINAREILQEIIINTKIKSAKQNLEYSKKQLESKRIEFDEIQNKLAYFNDSNINIVTSSVINERDKLEADFQIINAVMVELSKQVEQNKLQVSKNTPVFSIIKEATMPVLRSSPKRMQTVIIYGILGFVISIVYVLFKKPILEIAREINS